MYKFITLIILATVGVFSPVASMLLLLILVAFAYYTQDQGTATIASTMVITFRWLGISWGHISNVSEDTTLKLRIVDANNTANRIRLGMELDSKAIPAFTSAVAEVNAKYEASAIAQKNKLLAALARVEEAKAEAAARKGL